ncbi:MAG: PD40 domain-containing protein [Anaerolineae bacterium]|nr:PD40 domain-containing protein [Anaerolineae bacterium]
MAWWIRILVLVGILAALVIPGVGAAHGQQDRTIALAYVRDDTVTLADADGLPIKQTGPTFGYGQGARLFWTPDGRTLYIARDDGLYATGTGGGVAAHIPGTYGRTLTISQDAATLYYLETITPQPIENPEATEDDPLLVSFPFREMVISLMDGGAGRLAGYFGRFEAGSASADITFAAMLYARDGGLLGSGRPNLWPTYGSNVFGTCCFPNAGLGIFDANTGAYDLFDAEFMPGAAAINLTRTHLAGPTTTGAIRVIDLITGGTRDYSIQIAGGVGEIERIAWSPDDTFLYVIARRAPNNPMTVQGEPPFPIDARSANIVLYRLNLVTSVIRELAWRPDVYGVSALAATDRYVFAVIVDPNTALVNAWNARQVRFDAQPTDPGLAGYMPASHLWRVSVDGGDVQDVAANVWGLAARPVR